MKDSTQSEAFESTRPVSAEYFVREDSEARSWLTDAIKKHDPRSNGGTLMDFPLSRTDILFGYLETARLFGPAIDDTDGTTVTLRVSKMDVPEFTIEFPKRFLQQGGKPNPIKATIFRRIVDPIGRKIWGLLGW